jgi:signal transduction histidine kinase/ActR/RegA family two-component response regulator
MTVTSSDPQSTRVLVLMPMARDAERTVRVLDQVDVSSMVCSDLAELCRMLREGAGAVLLTDEAINGDASGQLSEALLEQPAWSAVPVIVLARESWTQDNHRLAPDSRNNFILVEQPVRTRTLTGVVLSALRGRCHQYQIRDALLMREQQSAQLLAQDERLRFALAAGRLGSWELDLETAQLDCSEICKVNFGCAEGQPFSYAEWQERIFPEDRARARAAIERSIREGADYDIEYRTLFPNGETRWVLVRGRSMQDAAGRRRMAGVSLDITEQKRMHEALQKSEAELARQAEELRRTDRRKNEFLATLAHELRNPLAPIRTGVDLLAHAPSPEAGERTLGVMQRQVGHMVRLIDDLLDVSRITSGKLELKRERIKLGSILDAAIEASRPLIERKEHTLRVDAPDAALCLDADLTRLAQVVGNLLNNASNYTPSGGLIQLSAKRERDCVVISVGDNGSGIPADRIDEVFEMFSQVHLPGASPGGLGIGLALVRSLVEMHGGTASATSPGLGRGSTFTIRLPLAPTFELVENREQSDTSPHSTSQKRVLVVDDNEDAADLLATMLESFGYQTRTAYDSRAALSAHDAWNPPFVIHDIGLPDVSGYDLARELRRRQCARPLALVALTGWGTHDDKQKAFASGFDVHFTKPVDATALNQALSRLEQQIDAPFSRKSASA